MREDDARGAEGQDDGPPESDHFGLFDDSGAASGHHPVHHEADTAEVDLGALREVLAGRRDASPAAPPPESPAPAPRSAARRAARQHAKRRRRRRVRSTIITLIVIGLIAAGIVIGFQWWQSRTPTVQDWAGTGTGTVVVRIQNGDGLYDIAQTLVEDGVVADATLFVNAASEDGRLAAIAPGYYRVHEHSSSPSTIEDLVDPDNRLGQLRIIPGQILADMTVVSTTGESTVKPGILSTIAEACVQPTGEHGCFSVDELWQVAETASLAELGIVGWAETEVAAAPDARRRLEGLILPGDYDIPPGSTALQALGAVVQASAAQWNTTGIAAAAKDRSMTPYQLAIIASLVQAEGGNGPDMRKVATVIYNRLAIDMKLQFDSTVNYGLDRAQISTTDAERLDPANLYSTYAHEGLPPTPIGAPGPQALDAADDPASGDWLYFVAIDLEGNSCFSVTFAEHEACIDEARANGVFG